jgi:hypothetical protein
MNDQRQHLFEEPDVPSMLALMTFVSVWGIAACTTVFFFASLGH